MALFYKVLPGAESLLIIYRREYTPAGFIGFSSLYRNPCHCEAVRTGQSVSLLCFAHVVLSDQQEGNKSLHIKFFHDTLSF